MRRRTFTVALVTAVPALTACGPPAGAPGDGPDTTIRLAETTEPTDLSPISSLYGLAMKCYEGLYGLTASGDVEPVLAAGPARADGQLTVWTVPVRTDRRFSDGTAVTVDDVVATYRAILDPKVGSPLATQFAILDEVVAVDDTVEFRLDRPYGGFDQLLTVGIGPAAAIGLPIDRSPLAREPVGSGPYRMTQWRAGESIVLDRDPEHPAQPYVERISIAFVSEQNAILQRASAGEFDGAQLAPALARTFDDRPGWQVWANPSADFRAVTFPRNHPGFADRRVRRALNLAVDRQRMVSGILYGYGKAAHTPFAAEQGTVFDPDATFAHDPDAAAELLAEAGWQPGADGIRRKDGLGLTLTVMYFPEDVLRRDLAVAFAGDMKQVGVAVEVEAVARPGVRQRIPDDGLLVGGGDMPYHPDQHISAMLDGRHADYDPDDPYRNPSGYRSATIDALLEEGRGTDDPAARARIYRDVQQAYVADPALVTLVTLEHTYIVRGVEQWEGPTPVLEPHEHGVAWGPWWHVERWRPR